MTRRRRRGVGEFKWWKDATSAWSLASKDSSGTTIYDLVGTNNGTSANTPVFTADQKGRGGQAMSYDGISDWITVADNDDLDFGTGSFTMSAWIKTTHVAFQTIVGKRTSANGYVFGVFNNGHLACFLEGDSGDSGFITGRIDISDGEWNHIVFVVTNSSVTYYINGVFDQTDSFTAVGSMNNAEDLQIGKSDALGFYEGYLSDIAIYPEAKSATWVAQQYARTK